MRILAIRGRNLASLADEFEVDLARSPLGGAGVFAIVGNTGAGKSTLLDALCVALFDRTPRLTNHSRVQVGRGDDDRGALGAQDVRTLLRRGAASGYAEVDFESGDSRQYRARWSVRRARNQSDGTLQSQQLTLVALDGGEQREQLGGTKTETLDAIHSRLGLSFDQFRRSALLAQGEFAAFLRADGKDRSELLERMTGTEIYSRLSMAAHTKAAAAEQRLRDGRTRADLIPVLADDARAEAQAAHGLAEAAKLAARARLAAAEAAARWSTEAARCARALADSESALAVATAELGAADPLRSELAVRRRAELLRPAFAETVRTGRAHGLAIAAAAQADAARVTASTAHAGALASRERLAALHGPLRAARIAARLVERPVARVARWQGDRSVELEADATWLAARAALADEVAAWPDSEQKLAEHAALGEAIAQLAGRRAAHEAVQAGLVEERSRVGAEHGAAAKKHAEAQRKAAGFQQRRGISLDAARRQEDEARTRVSEVERLVAIAARASEAAATRAALDAQLAELEATAAVDNAHHDELATARATATTLRSERTRVVAELRRAAGFAHARAELVAGDECPLCGATEHPWHGRGALDGVIQEAERALAAASTAHEQATTALARLVARGESRARERTRLVAQHAAADAGMLAAREGWRDQLSLLGELQLEGDPITSAATRIAADLLATARDRLEVARTTSSQAQAAAKAAQDAQADVQLCQAMVDQHATRLADLDKRLSDLALTLERLDADHTLRAERQAQLGLELEAIVGRWHRALVAAGDRTAAELAHAVQPSRIATLVAQWRAVGERVATAELELAAALVELDHEVRALERTMSEHSTRHTEHAKRRDDLAHDLASAVAALDAARVDAGFTADALRELLGETPVRGDNTARIDELTRRLDTLERAVGTARTVVAERRRLVDEHRATRAAHADALAAAAVGHEAGSPIVDAVPARYLAELTEHAAQAEAEAGRLTSALAADADARVRREAARHELARAEAAVEVDRVLGEVIGSHDGKLFRSFAQSLTLDGLLAVANAHLEELAPRYQLERVPKHDLELQVIDRDLGSEVRSVQSLSGGESFLVSLALALGLSSMSAQDVRVRTLLIDEGFGTLDPATLDGALAVLDRLQATGRQVGVISHVPALIERVGAHVRVVQRGGGRSEVVVG